MGKAIPSQHYQIKNVPKRSMKNSYHQQRYYSNAAGYKLNDSQGRNSNISSAVSDISTVTLTEETFQNNDDILEENSIEVKTNKFYYPKIFSEIPDQDMNLSDFKPKKQASNWLTQLVWFFGGETA